MHKEKACELIGLPIIKNLILFGAMGGTSDPRKGFSKLSQALDHIDIVNTELIIFGSCKTQYSDSFRQRAHYVGHIHDDVILRLLYSSADVMVVPSLQENLSNVIMKSLSCGIPVVGFNIGGNGDMIDSEKNGYLAYDYRPEDLANGINWIIHHNDSSILSANARRKIVNVFESKIIIKRYVQLYHQLVVAK